MSSISACDVLAPPAQSVARRDLLVLWQHPESRAISAVGRLSYDGETYTYCYTRGALRVEGFRPLPGLRDMSKAYSSTILFPLFAQRVMDPSRPGYERYISRLGLTSDESSPWEQIVRSGGMREGDTLQFLPHPYVAEGVGHATFLANGVRWISTKGLGVPDGPIWVTAEEQERSLSALHQGSKLGLLPEPSNPKHRDALLITANGTPVAYVPQFLASAISRIGPSVELRVVRVNGPEAPPHLRLVVHMQAPVSDAFSFDPDGDWDPTAREE